MENWDSILFAFNSILNFFNDNNLLTTIIGILITTIVTLKVIEERKRISKRNVMLKSLLHELKKFNNKTEENPYYIRTRHRNHLLWNLLSTDALDYIKDRELIEKIYEMVGWTENFNTINDLANLALIHGNYSAYNEIREKRDGFHRKAYQQSRVIIQLINDKYKI